MTAVHSGNAGDIIYCIPTFRYLGISKLILNINGDFYPRTHLRGRLAVSLLPLLESQKINAAIQGGFNSNEVDYNFDEIRKNQFNTASKHLIEIPAEYFGAEINPYDSFLEISNPIKDVKIVINFTDRWLNTNFDINYLLSNIQEPIAFIGHDDEYTKLLGRLKKWNIFHYKTNDLLHAARVIAGADIFIGSPSACFAIAEGLKCPRILSVCPESPAVRACDNNDNAVNVMTDKDLIKAKQFIINKINME